MPEALKRYGPEALGATTALLVATLYLATEPCPDVAWQLWIGHQLRHGARLYIDIIETNPPLWFWMAMPVDWLADRLGTGANTVLVSAMGLASALSVIATGRLLAHLAPPVRAATLVYAALALMLMPLQDMGQREQILLIAALPFIALAAARYERRTVSPWLAVAIGTGAALGFALKHYFLITPALIELWLLIGLRKHYRPLRPETIALGLMALLYATAVLTLSPAYLTKIVPMLRLMYGAMRVDGVAGMIHPQQYYWAMMIAALLFCIRTLSRTPLASAYAIAALGFGAAWLIQFKGWHYHEIATTGCLMMAIALLAAERWAALMPLLWVTVPALLATPLAFSIAIGPYRDVLEPVTRPMLTGLGRNDGVTFVSEVQALAWPLNLRRGFRYPSRYYGMEILHALIADRGHTPGVTELASRFVDDSALDYACAQPVRIIFDMHDRAGFDLEAYFLSHPRFAALMEHYRRIGRFHQFDVFQRIAPFPTPPASACRRGV